MQRELLECHSSLVCDQKEGAGVKRAAAGSERFAFHVCLPLPHPMREICPRYLESGGGGYACLVYRKTLMSSEKRVPKLVGSSHGRNCTME